MAYGEYNSARLKSTWKDTSKPAKDATGWKRGGRSWEDNESKFMRSADPKADDFMYGKYHGDKRPDGGTSPGDLTDRFKGAKGVDAGDDSDGVR